MIKINLLPYRVARKKEIITKQVLYWSIAPSCYLFDNLFFLVVY